MSYEILQPIVPLHCKSCVHFSFVKVDKKTNVRLGTCNLNKNGRQDYLVSENYSCKHQCTLYL